MTITFVNQIETATAAAAPKAAAAAIGPTGYERVLGVVSGAEGTSTA